MGPNTAQISRWALLEGFHRVLAVVEDDAGERVIHAVVDVVAELAVAHRLADDRGDQRGRGGHMKRPGSARISRLGEEAVEFGIDARGQFPEGFDLGIVGGGEAAADVEEFEFMPRASASLKMPWAQAEGLDEVFEVGGLCRRGTRGLRRPVPRRARPGSDRPPRPGMAPNFEEAPPWRRCWAP